MPPGELVEILSAGFNSTPAHLVGSRHDQNGVEVILKAHFEEQRHLAHQKNRRRITESLPVHPLLAGGSDERMYGALQERHTVVLRVRHSREPGTVDRAIS